MVYDYLPLDQHSKKPLYQQLYEQIRRAVQEGHLSQGEKMPSIRKLAEDLELSRTTIEAAYQQLCVEGYLKSKPQSGYFVAASSKGRVYLRRIPVDNYRRIQRALVKYNLGTDVVDLQNADLLRWKRCVKDVLNRRDVLVSYGEKQGEQELREALSSYSYSVRGVVSTADSIVIGAGTQQLLSVLCGLLPRDSVIAIEEPGFRQAEQVFQDYGFPLRLVGGDQEGISMRELEASKASVLFVSPSNRMKARDAIPMSRRFEILNWAQQRGRLVIEDDYNGELRYSAKPIPALQSLSDGKRVAYLGSFSKLLLPSVRIGYLAMPEELAYPYWEKSAGYNQTASKIEQLALARYIQEGSLERQLRRLRKLYAAKSAMFFQEVTRAFQNRVKLSLWETSLCFRLEPSSGIPRKELVRLALSNGVRLTLREGRGEGDIIAGFAGIPAEGIPEAVAALREAWNPVLDRKADKD